MFRFIKNIFFGLLTSLVVNATSHTKCISLSNQKCEIQSTFFFDKKHKNPNIILKTKQTAIVYAQCVDGHHTY